MNLLDKLTILSDAAKYDAACTSSGAKRGYQEGKIGCTSTSVAGCCHTFSADGRCVTLLKVLLSNDCCYNCKYCVNRCTNNTPRATFTPEELAELTIEFYRRNYIEGLFLSSRRPSAVPRRPPKPPAVQFDGRAPCQGREGGAVPHPQRGKGRLVLQRCGR